MALNLYLPPSAAHHSTPVPLLLYLSGLTCTPDNCTEKGFFQNSASKQNIALCWPDTSPRRVGSGEAMKVEGEGDSWDFGLGAGFYVDATVDKYAKGGYKMWSYVTKELLPTLWEDVELGKFLEKGKVSVTGHSMGGHGALVAYLRNPGVFRSCSAFAPIANPVNCPWGQKAFNGYLGDNKEEWKKYDATELVKGWSVEGMKPECLVDVGTGDGFYKNGQLLPENLEEAAKERGFGGVKVRYQPVSEMIVKVGVGEDR